MEVAKVLDDKYEIIYEIKRGGFGVIYYGRDRLFDKPVAIKAIPPELIGEARYIDIFQAESLAIARLNHRNIVRIYDIRRGEGGQFYIIMEYVDGIDLGKLIRASRKEPALLPPYLAAYIVAEICAGLDYAHTRRDPDTHQPLHLVHQDISPGNIMLNRLGEVKIIDFGLAGARRHQADNHRKNEVVVQGKLTYLAPEQVNGSGSLDQRADLFSLGVVFYEALTGQRLFKEQDAETMIRHLRNGEWDLSLLAENRVPAALIKIVEKAIQREPSQRFQSANQMYMELMSYLSQHAPALDYAMELANAVARVAPAQESRAASGADSESGRLGGFAGFEEMPAADPHAGEATTLNDVFTAEGGDDRGFEATPRNRSTAQQPRSSNTAQDEFEWRSGTTQRDFPEELELTPEPEDVEQRAKGGSEPQDVAFYKVIAEEEEEEEVRTIIDVIRLSARSHKKTIFLSVGGVLAAFLLFTLVDTFTRWTAWGASIYDFLFPPAIRLVSFPPNAQVYLDDRLLPKTTPLAIEKISPGVHKLTLTLPRFEPITRSIQVAPQGRASIIGEGPRDQNLPYVFRFKTVLEISSKPEGAEVYLNNVKYTQLTPCRVVWEVGDPLEIEMRKEGLSPLRGFTLNTLEGIETITDRRLWRFQRIEEQREHYALEGIFAKAITITSVPDHAEIYVNDGTSPMGMTGYSSELLLATGSHTITLQKPGFLPKSFSITVDANTPSTYHEVLSRVVRIFAKDGSDPGDNDIGARVVELISGGQRVRTRSTTPCELTLLPYTYTAILSKEGYQDYTLTIPPTGNIAIARMEGERIEVEVVVQDEQTEAPLSGVQISYQPLTQPNAVPAFFGQTEENGTAVNKLAPGQYRFRVKKFGYRLAVKELKVSATNKRLVFKLQSVS
ncbi:MAG: PEGA domain-containing protein [candidate division KSB1 bacterium]|nr:PEGA domain-containing protein [candidate division KSB1 bacterium]MDZ7273646.1 PEGA domain-containing protein [candidate division KSB1 bacterium]MDZ7286763.1 PEGA domain-containing protein [candidate division KSB1 bacterium]MDZ7299880.1 PEGA domain-containing protein [candidate division KSB1 bacterium]MDZ7305817.1 PEGA domain-containing protein [candidate division KSB1 bacterium]